MARGVEILGDDTKSFISTDGCRDTIKYGGTQINEEACNGSTYASHANKSQGCCSSVRAAVI